MEEDIKDRILSRRRSAALKAFKVKDERLATVKKVDNINFYHNHHMCTNKILLNNSRPEKNFPVN